MADSFTFLQFRIAEAEDAAKVQQLIQAAFRAKDSREEWTADTALNLRFTLDIAYIEQTITDPESNFLVAYDGNGEIVGTIGVLKRESDLARIFMLAVDQHRQQGGLGRQILTYAEQYCQRTWGVTRVGLDALSTRRQLISWYVRRGYRETGETKPFPREIYSDLELPDDLCFVQFEKPINPLGA
ncbi:hypothetical protein PENSTE_c006G09354 [Penicillium steckii]|uniref:N-acetyltransferase domain-containing protein n=1 Tax=Penicillium steckii TaxID=303698 RepID=A0A1V6TFY5_9EURO|nr:hypothetical protein PENSTE_c006G09354 [Penicillium steckii]